MLIATLSWNKNTRTADIHLDATDGDDVADGARMLQRAAKETPWRGYPGISHYEPESALSFFYIALEKMGYQVHIAGDIHGAQPTH